MLLLFGVLFFLLLMVVGIILFILFVEVCFVVVFEKFSLSWEKIIGIMGIFFVLVFFVFVICGGFMFLDVVDYFVNNFGLIIIVFVEVVMIGFILCCLLVY